MKCISILYHLVVLYLFKELSISVGKSSPWMSVDTALYVLKESDGRGEPLLVSFTDLRNKEVRAGVLTQLLGLRSQLSLNFCFYVPSEEHKTENDNSARSIT